MEQILRFGLSAVTADGYDVGSVHRVVLNLTTLVATAVVVQRPLLTSGNLLKPGGWERPRDQRVPFAAITGADADEVRLNLTEAEFLALPPYVLETTPQQGSEGDSPPGFVAEDLSLRVGALLGTGVYEPRRDERENRTADERHISGGTAVWRREPHTHVGDLAHVILDDVSGALEALVVRQGHLFPHETVVPVGVVTEILDDLIHIALSEAQWAALQPYRAD